MGERQDGRSPRLSVVIPAFNEAGRIVPTLEALTGYLAAQSYSYEVVVVDDGSSDGTASVVEGWIATRSNVRLERIPHSGKGWAVKRGMQVATGRYRLTCDADLAMPVEWIARFLERMDDGYDVVIGSRQIAGARRFGEPVLRHMMGRVFNWTVRLIALRGFEDTQCGFKCFKGEVADDLFSAQRTRGFGFDVEVLYLAVNKRALRVLEMPIDWYHQRSSKVRPGIDSFLMTLDTLRVRWRDLRGRYEAGPGTVSAAAPASNPDDTGEVRAESQPASTGVGGVTIVVPTYNEAENLPELVRRLFALDMPDTRLIVVDDGSPDGTGQVARELAERFGGRLELIERTGKQGLGTAYLEGFARAVAGGGRYVVQMDADLSHGPEYVPDMVRALGRSDVVVGSRYVPGGGVDSNWSLARRLLSSYSNKGIRFAAGLKVRDATSGFKAFKVDVLRSLQATQFKCKGFGFQAEVASACQRLGYKVSEHPIMFVDRSAGQSKMSSFIAMEALWRLSLLRLRRRGQVRGQMR